MKAWIGAAVIVVAALGYEIYALSQPDVWEWSEILFRISEIKFLLVIVSWFIGYVMGHALAPHVSRFRKRVLKSESDGG